MTRLSDGSRLLPHCFCCNNCERLSPERMFTRTIRRSGKKEVHEIRMCNLHNIECGESSIVCKDATNLHQFDPPKEKKPTGWEDF